MTTRPLSMRILHAIPSIDAAAGGPATAMLGLATAQARVGLDVTVLSMARGSENPAAAADRMRQAGVCVELIGPASGALMRHPDLPATVERIGGNADAVHVHGLWEEVQHLACRAAARRGIPCVIRPCGMLTAWSLAQSRWKKRLYLAWRLRRNLRGAAAFHFTSDVERDTSYRAGSRAQAITEPIGVPFDEFTDLPAPGSFRARYPQLTGRRLIVFLGRIHPGKGMEHLVPALARVRVPDAVVVAVGGNSENYRATIESLVAAHGLADRVLFTGELRGRDRVAALVDADLFCLPSDHENFGIAVIEALAAGTPVVISDQVAIHAEITAAGVGAAVSRNPEPLADALTRWLTDDTLRAAARAKARPFVWERYDWTRIAQRWVGHYQRLIERRPT